MFLDLDGFKFVNDTLGHAAGDVLISRVGGLLRGAVRETDTLARMGGDEFALLLTRCDRRPRCASPRSCSRSCAATGSPAPSAAAGCRARSASRCSAATISQRRRARRRGRHRDVRGQGRGQGSLRGLRPLAPAPRPPGLRESWSARLERAIACDGFVLHAQPIAAICGDGTPRSSCCCACPTSSATSSCPARSCTTPSASASSSRSIAGCSSAPCATCTRATPAAAT